MSTGTENAQTYDVDRRKEGDRAADGKSTAAERLFADSREANKGSKGGQFDNQTIAKLEQQGILPQLAIEFTKSADANDLDGDGDTTETVFSAIDTDGKNGITADELQVARTSQNASVLDKRLLQQLGNDYDELRYTTETGVDGISQDDVNAYITTQDAALSNDTQVRDASARLLLNPDLFNIADTASGGGTGDGAISKDDLKTLIEKYGKGELPSSITQDDINSMQFLVSNWDESFVGGDNSGIRDTKGERDTQKGTGLTRASIQIGLGLPADGSGTQTLFDQVSGIDSQYGQQYAAAYSAKYGQDFPSSVDAPTTTEHPDVPSPTSGNPPTEQSEVPSPTSGNPPTEQSEVPSPTSGNPPTEQPVYTTDANGAKITTYQGQVTEVAYPNGQARDFGYDQDNKLIAYKDADNKVYNYKDGAWVSAENGQPAPFSDVTVDQAGKVTVTNTDGSTTAFDTKNEAQAPTPTADVPPAADAPPATDAPPAADSVETYTVQSGQGFDRIAREVYTQALGHPPSAAEERALSELIAAANDNDRSYSGGALHPGDALVVPNLQELTQQAEQQGVPLETYIRNASEQIVASLKSPAESTASTDSLASADNSAPADDSHSTDNSGPR